MTMTGNDPITAIVDQLAACAEQLTRLDTREADHLLPDAQNERGGVTVDEHGASAIRAFRRAGCS